MKTLASLILCGALLAGCRTTGASTPAPASGTRLVPIAVVPFALMPGTPTPPVDVAEAIRTDLVARGRFAPTDVASMPAHPSDPADVRFNDWRHLAVDYLVVGRVGLVHDGGHEVEYQVVDARTETTLFGFQVPSAPDALGTTAREIADAVARRLEG